MDVGEEERKERAGRREKVLGKGGPEETEFRDKNLTARGIRTLLSGAIRSS